ncbi:protein anon-37Cs [Glossina fuscipes]|uniref:Protein anon-37Cs n=1 Tax=Glossina fuscipes TaxID=7396 RepID=A0A8U0WG72_9MUSC|nr:protein anon-37Cs [Glossina fuscipes]KAI9585716.1 hypothetical protein GQX74_001563 [Glossina fuscipes]
MQCFKRVQYKLINAKVISTEIPNVADAQCKSCKEIQTVIIGAGLAGLSAANHLIKNGYPRTFILEATNRYGGRVNSKQFGDAFCELGAKWITIDGSKNSMYELLRQATSLQKSIQQKQDAEYRDTLGQTINKYLPEVVNVYFRKLCAGIDLTDRIKNGRLYELNNVHTYFQSEAEKIVNSMFKERDRSVVVDIFITLMKEYGGSLGCNLEYLNVEQLLKFKNQFAYPIYVPNGLNNIFQEIIANIEKDHLQTGKPVGEIRWSDLDREDKKYVNCLDGTVFPADHIICTLPLGVLKTFSGHMFKPPLPPEKTIAIKNIGFGSPVKIYFEYKKLVKHWFKNNLRPLWSAKERNADLNWIKQIVEVSKLPTSNRVLEISIGGAYYDEIEKLPDSELITEVTKLLRKCLNNPQIPFPKEILRSNWSTSACYLGGRPYFSTNSSVNDVNTLARPLGYKTSLLFAGDATILQGFGTLDGARLSGIREAQRIIEYYGKN